MRQVIFHLKRPPEVFLLEAKRRVSQYGGTLTGDVSSGSYQVKKVAGEYSITDGRLIITIRHSPWYIPDSVVDSIVAKQVESLNNNECS